jgi:transcriptional regulator with XRE-family HTH domain
MPRADRWSQESAANGVSPELSARIRAARKGRGWTQQQVALKVGITVRSVSGWERGKAIPHLNTLCALARLLGQEPEHFVATAQSMAARRRAQRLDQVAPRIESALRQMVARMRVDS